MYRTLDPEKIVASLVTLEKRIEERFPHSGLGRVCAELNEIARENKARAEKIARPNMLLRAGVLLLLGALALLLSRVGMLIDLISAKREGASTTLNVNAGAIDSGFTRVARAPE